MRLDQWMTETGTADDVLAALVEADRSTISRIRRGTRMPSPEMMRKLFEATAGAVTANDFVHAPAAADPAPQASAA